MANQEHLDLLKQGVDVWNRWKKKLPPVQPDLRHADLRSVKLRGADLSGADFTGANLSGADFTGVNLFGANLSGADLSSTRFRSAILRDVNLMEADLRGADLSDRHLRRETLSGANLSEAHLGWTILGNLDLRTVKGLETIVHHSPSIIGTDTLERSQGDIPVIFLQGVGVSDALIEYARSLVAKPIDYYTCFISYSSKDHIFAERLHVDLQAKGVRCWFAPEDLKIGDKFRHRIDEAIRLYDKLLVVISKHSVASAWVEDEVMAALEKENQHNKLVLFPIRLDEAVMQISLPWAASMRRSRHIGDFTRWKEHDAYQQAFTRLLLDLQGEKPDEEN